MTLPCALVGRIIHYLPLSMHGQCALVCRSWHRAVPDTRKTLANWWRQLSLQQHYACRHLAAGYEDRIRPWLISQGSSLLPDLERQHQALRYWQHLQAAPDGTQQQQRPCIEAARAERWFAALVHYSLHQSFVTAGPQSLQPVVLPALDGPVSMLRFSGCSRWLAVGQNKEPEPGPAFLRLYRWHQHRWQQERLLEDPAQPVAERPVDHCVFSALEPNRLFSVHDGGQLVSWLHQAAAGGWQPVRLMQTDNRISFLQVSGGGDLLLGLRRQDEACSWRRLLILYESQGRRELSRIVSRDYSRLIARAMAPCHQQMALVCPLAESATELVAVHIWHDSGSTTPGDWHCVQTCLEQGQQIQRLTWSPDGRHLLGLMAGGRAGLWALDDNRRLQLRLDVACVVDAFDPVVAALRPFHNSGRQLVLAPSPHQLQLYQQQPDGLWHPGESLTAAQPVGEPADEKIRRLQWSADGQTLLQVSTRRLIVWHQDPPGYWRQWLCQTPEDDRGAPAASSYLVSPFFDLWITVIFREGQVSICGTGPRGQLETKSCTRWGYTVAWCYSSPDGLSQFFSSPLFGPLLVRQLAAPVATGRPAAALATEAMEAVPDSPGPERGTGHEPLLSDAAVIACSPDSLSHGARLPRELLQLIFHYLPLSDHSQCALVCRRWYASLPAFRWRLARWQQGASPSQRARSRFLALGYSRQLRPWLQAWHSPLLPALERQHHVVCQPHRPAQLPLLSGLVHYSLHQQITRMGRDQLGLRTFAVRNPSQTVFPWATLSPCGRWIAAQNRPDPPGPPVLQLYSQQGGAWQEDSLRTPLTTAVSNFRFSPVAPDTLFSTHGADLFVWRRAASHRHWHRQGLWHSPHLHDISSMSCFPCGDMIISCREEGERSSFRLCVFQAPEKSQGSHRPTVHLYNQEVYGLVTSWACHQLALIQSFPGTGLCKHQIHIWHRAAVADPPAPWWCTTSVIGSRAAAFVDMRYSTDGRHLLVLFSWGRLSLFVRDAQYRLEEQLALCCHVPRADITLESLVSVSQDGQRMAVVYGEDKVQLWDRACDGRWSPGALIDRPASPDGDPQEELLFAVLAAGGRALLCGTLQSFSVWQQDDQGWTRSLHHRAPPDAQLLFSVNDQKLGPCPLFSVAASDPQGSLWLYGPDVQGRMIRKATMTMGAPVIGLGGSSDGLSLLVACEDGDTVVQLAGPVEAGAQDPGQDMPPGPR